MWITKKNLDNIVSKLISDVFVELKYSGDEVKKMSKSRQTIVNEIGKIIKEKAEKAFNDKYIQSNWTIHDEIEDYIKDEEFIDRLVNKINKKQLQ